jgi:hypothetical protein
MAISLPPLDEGASIHPVVVRSIELAAPAIAGGTVALEVANMSECGPAADLQTDDARLDDHAAHALAWTSLASAKLQSIGRGLAPPDPRAAALPGPCRTGRAHSFAAQLCQRQRPAIGLGGGSHHLRHESAWLPTNARSPIADASGAWTKIGTVVATHAGDVTTCDQEDNRREVGGALPATKTKVWRG